MQRLTILVVLLALTPLAAAANLAVTDPRVTVGGVTIHPDADDARETTPESYERTSKASAVERRASLTLRTPDQVDPVYESVARNPYVQISFGDVEYLLGLPSGPQRTFLLLPGSEISVPLTTREVAAAPRPLPVPAPKLLPLTQDVPEQPAEQNDAPAAAPRPRAPAAEPVRTQTTEAAPPPSASWPERAVLAGAAAVLILAPLALYHRLRGTTVLGHDSRAKLLELLRTRPGLTPADAARDLGVDPSTALYHLRRLVKEGIATTDGERRGARYFAAGTVAPQDRTRVVFERESADLLTAIRAEPGTSKTTLAGRLAIARATLHWHLTRLERAGLVRCERAGREVKVFPAPSQQTFS